MAHIRTIGLAGALAAASFTFSSPAQAADLAPAAQPANPVVSSVFGTSTYDAAAETSEYRRRYRGWRRYRRNRIDAGDVFAGVLILGGIAAIANAANNNRRDRYEDRRYRYEDRRDRDRDRYDDRRRSNPRSSGSGIDSAVSQCLGEIERDVRVDSVDNATRGPSGWEVSGTLFNGSGFTCRIDNSGRISDIDYGGFSSSADFSDDGFDAQAEGQWSDDRYARARATTPRAEPTAVGDLAAVDGNLAVTTDEPRPAYPGGPLPGEESFE